MSFLSRLFAFLGSGQEPLRAPALPVSPVPWPVSGGMTPTQAANEVPADVAIPLLPPAPLILTTSDIASLFPHASNPAGWAAALDSACYRHGIASKVRLAAFLAQVGHESGGLTRLVENLNYSEAALRAQWPSRFTPAQAAQWGRNASHAASQQAIANQAYGGRLGNGLPATGDGWRFRGRGLIQLTGRTNYARCAAALMIPLSDLPDYLETQVGAAEASAWWWEDAGCNALAEAGDFVVLTKRINGGTTGLDDRVALWEKATTLIA